MSDTPLDPNEFPLVLVPGGPVSITRSAHALFTAIARSQRIFWGTLGAVELVETNGVHEAQLLKPAAATSAFEKFVRFQKRKGSSQEPTVITEATARQYLTSQECRVLLPKLNGILRCPILVERNGKLHVVGPGYDATTGYFVEVASNPEVVPLKDAVENLELLLNHFAFVTPSDRSRALASLITPALKLGGLLKGLVPVDVAEADDSQAGKTYRQKVLAALYNHELAVVTKKTGGVGSLEETFCDHLINGRVFIQFDNLRGKLNSEMLESFLTSSGKCSARVPYQGNVQVDPSKFIVMATSNGFEAPKDLTNRASIIRIRKQANATFPVDEAGDDLLRAAFKNQSLLFGSVAAVVKEWFRRGKPKTTEPRHDFREWCQTLDWIVQNIFKAAPLMTGHEEAKVRVSSPHLTFMRVLAMRLEQEGKLGVGLSATELADICIEHDIEIPGAKKEGLTAGDGCKQLGKILGKVFDGKDELVCEQFRIRRTERRGQSGAGNPQTLKSYTFTLAVRQPDVPVQAVTAVKTPNPV